MIIGNWTLNSETNLISNGNTVIQLEPKLVAVLVYLASKPGVVVSREQLMTDVWEGAIVTDHAVNRVIGKLRKVLNQDSEVEEYIVTVPKKGYQLKAVVSGQSNKPDLNEFNIFEVKYLVIAALVVVTTVIAWSFNSAKIPLDKLGNRTQLAEKRPVFNHVLPFTSQRGQEYEAAYSPNGEFIAFNHTPVGEKTSDTYVRNVSTGKTIQVTNSPEDEIRPTWSPNGRHLLVLRLKGKQCQYVKIDFDPLTMKPLTEKVVLSCDASLVIGAASWDTNNDTFYYPRGISISQPFSIYSYQISTGRQSKVTQPPKGSIGDYHAELSPTGNQLVYLRAIKNHQTDVLTIDLVSGKNRKLFHLPWMLDKISWAKDNKHLLYAEPSGKIIEFDITQQKHSVVWVNADKVNSPVYSPIKDEIIFTSGSRFNSDIMSAKIIGAENKVKIEAAELVVDSIGGDIHPQYANNSMQFAYFSTRSGLPQIWLRNIEGEERQVSHFESRMAPSTLQWSNDDSRLLSSTGERIYSISIDTGDLIYHTEETINARLPSWSKDNNTIYFSSNHDGDWQIWQVLVTDPKAFIKLTKNGGFSSQTDRFAKYLYFNKFNENGIWRFNLNTQHVDKVMSDFPINSYYNWRLIGDNLYYLSDDPNNNGINVYNLVQKSNHFIGPAKHGHRGFSISVDQKEVLWVKITQSEINLKHLSIKSFE